MPIGRRAVILGALAAAGAASVIGAVGASAAEPVDRAEPATSAQVEATQQALDRRAASAPDSVVSWGVDPALGVVVVAVRGGRSGEVERFLAGLDPRTYRVDRVVEAPRPMSAADD